MGSRPRTFPKKELLRAMNFVAVPSLVGPLIGPALGGLVISISNWRAIFFMNIPIGCLGLATVYLFLPDFHNKSVSPLDWRGLLYFGGGISLLSWVFEVFGEYHAVSTRFIAATIAATILFMLYWRHARNCPHPLIEIKLLQSRTYSVAVSGGFITRLGVGGAPFLLPLLYQTCLGLNPVQSGMLIMPQALGAMLSKIFIRNALKIIGYRTILIGNTALLGAALMDFGTINPFTPKYLIVLQAIFYGILMSSQFTALTSLTYADIPSTKTSHAGALASTFQQLSLSFGITTAGIVTAVFMKVGRIGHPQILTSFQHAFFPWKHNHSVRRDVHDFTASRRGQYEWL